MPMLVRYSQVNSLTGTMAKSSAEEKSSCWISFCSHSAIKAGVVRPSSNKASQLSGADETLGICGGTGDIAAGGGVGAELACGGNATGAEGVSVARTGGSSTGSVKFLCCPKPSNSLTGVVQ